MSVDVSIIVLNYNTCRLTMDCLRSVYDSETNFVYEIILIDNNSRDDSVERISREFPGVMLIANSENVGYARANNQGMEVASGRYVLLLNSDTVVRKDTLQTMISFMDSRPDIGASGCKVILPDGSLDKACKRGFPTPSASFYYAFGFSKLFPDRPRFNGYQLGYLDPDQDYPVDCLVGAFMLLRRETIEQVGGLDEDFFMYGEDLDWCFRIKEAGWGIYYYPQTSIIHLKGGSARRRPFKIVYEFHRAMILFHRKHYSKRYNSMINGAVYTGVGVKFVLSLVRNALIRPRTAPSPAQTLTGTAEAGSRTESNAEVRL
ncbi:glycosyltransferase family 2 protein [Paenibacillus sonchi]|uniref:Glycosyltransferase family 2 protein n=2 Tax=Paenibacillus sonchi group TaxID=2044880 RepID=A0A974PEQ7_9BACL|nr:MULTISPECIES: glycosyltransferase family 2 protein [Paenibacillus sonchi group]QQZ62136.1 glycosyltransferase family 2 protein [Paenibacillus sonchi]